MESRRVIYDEYGQTGNRFFSYIDSVGQAIINKKKCIILFPEDILKYYDNFRNSPYIKLPLWGWREKFVWKIARKLLYYNSVIQLFYKTSLAKRMGFYSGWTLRSSMDYYPNVKQEVFRIFTPNKNITEPIDELFASERKLGKLIIGVHIRKGDYKNYMGGKYYFDDSVFMRYMDSVKSFKPNCVFFVASNESVSSLFAQQYPILPNPVNNVSGDMYALSQCDYIMGPPSTFSGWASLVGNVPLYYIKNKSSSIVLEDFKPMRG